ncbi:MAG: hypothetical protein ACRDK2_02145 [Solirubrobacteraceae bacterium]
MIVRKILLLAGTVALLSTPTWALANPSSDQGNKHAPSTTPVGPPSTTPNNTNNTNNPGSSHRSSKGTEHTGGQQSNHNAGQGNGQNGKPPHPEHPKHPGHPAHPAHPNHPSHPGKSHQCMPHRVAYIASGTLVSQTLSKNTDGTYSGTVTVTVTHTNRHAAGDQGMTKIYTLTNGRVKLDVVDVNHDGSIGLDDLQAGDRVKLIGNITTLAKKCDQTGFTAQTTIAKVIFHPSHS